MKRTIYEKYKLTVENQKLERINNKNCKSILNILNSILNKKNDQVRFHDFRSTQGINDHKWSNDTIKKKICSLNLYQGLQNKT